MGEKTITNKQRREESDARILNAAIRSFGRKGYANSSIAEIAKAAGVSPGLITNRYASKEELYGAAFVKASKGLYFDYEGLNNAKDFLTETIKAIIKLNKKDIDAFDFMAMYYVSFDNPHGFLNRAREDFIHTEMYEILVKAQEEGMIPKGDIINLVDAFLTHVYVQIGVCQKYGTEIPSYDYFLSSILEKIVNEKEFYNQQYVDLLIKEYQSAWFIRLEDESFSVFTYDEKKAAPNSVKRVQRFKSYNDARIWYIDNYVVEQSKKRMLVETELSYVLSKVTEGESFFVEYGRIANGEINYNQLCYHKIVNWNGDIECIAMGFRNIDIGKRVEIDDLTGLLTRASFFRKAEEKLAGYPEMQFDILISDIVDFKKINEVHGILVADEILKWNGKYLSQLDNEKIIIGRYGGDQFVLFGAHDYMQYIMGESGRKSFFKAESENGLPSVTTKFGIYENIPHDMSVLSSCDKAHMALNSIKHQYGKEIEYYNSVIRSKLEKHRRVEESMYTSLNDGDFKVFYQPKHDVQTGKLVGAEALVRWIHPEYGFMRPDEFIPIFEHNGFIVEIDRFVWKKTCENIRRWMDKGIEMVPVSVNASKLTMLKPDIVYNMKKTVSDNKLKASQLHIEITESLMSENVEDLVDKLNEIRKAGFKVELDDFGSGYSSINVLNTLPIDILKLDRSFMNEFGNEKRYLVLEACIDLAKKLGFETVSEGVEIREQKEELESLGVDIIQGYYYSKPLSEEEFEQYMLENADEV